MQPEAFAKKHPKLFHLTRPSSLKLINQYGMLSARALCDLYEVANPESILRHRRAKTVELTKSGLPTAFLNDNRPLSEKALMNCLDDDLSPSDWLGLLNERVFFWVDEKRFERLANGPAHKGEQRVVLVLDTRRILESHIEKAAISPINTGNTCHKPARRGHSTFARLENLDYDAWRRCRPKKSLDNVVEVSFDYALSDAQNYIEDKFSL